MLRELDKEIVTMRQAGSANDPLWYKDAIIYENLKRGYSPPCNLRIPGEEQQDIISEASCYSIETLVGPYRSFPPVSPTCGR
jgi:hypothetical protein